MDHDKAALLKLIGHGLPLTAVETGRALSIERVSVPLEDDTDE